MQAVRLVAAFGLSMDYEVFVTARIKELHDLGQDNASAVVNGLGHTGRIVSAAATDVALVAADRRRAVPGPHRHPGLALSAEYRPWGRVRDLFAGGSGTAPGIRSPPHSGPRPTRQS